MTNNKTSQAVDRLLGPDYFPNGYERGLEVNAVLHKYKRMEEALRAALVHFEAEADRFGWAEHAARETKAALAFDPLSGN